MLKSLTLILIVTLILQSCVAYQKTSVSLKEAENMGKAKVITLIDSKLILKNIEIQDGVYYAQGGPYEITILDSAQIKAIYLKDIKKSKRRTWLTLGIGVPVVLFVSGLIIFYSSL